MTLSQTYADFATRLTIDAIPDRVKERARYLILDSVGTGLAAVGTPWAEASFAAAGSRRSRAGSGRVDEHVIHGGERERIGGAS